MATTYTEPNADTNVTTNISFSVVKDVHADVAARDVNGQAIANLRVTETIDKLRYSRFYLNLDY